MGHVLNNTIQDILARRARQLGHSALWLPGTDHAGIATQAKVEQALRAEEKVGKNWAGKDFSNTQLSGEISMEALFLSNLRNLAVPVTGIEMCTHWTRIIRRL